MKKEAPLRTYQATSLELVAIGYLILHHARCFDQHQQVSKEELEMTTYVQSFFDRLMTQLPGEKFSSIMADESQNITDRIAIWQSFKEVSNEQAGDGSVSG